MEKDGKKEKMIHVRLSDDAHRQLRILAAESDTTIQKWVESIVTKELEKYKRDRERKPNR